MESLTTNIWFQIWWIGIWVSLPPAAYYVLWVVRKFNYKFENLFFTIGVSSAPFVISFVWPLFILSLFITFLTFISLGCGVKESFLKSLIKDN